MEEQKQVGTESQEKDVVQWGTSKEYEKTVWPDGIYKAVLQRIEDFEAEHGLKKRLLFSAINDALGKNAEFCYSAYPNVTSKTKMGNLVVSLGIKEGVAFCWNDLIGVKCQVLLETKEIKGEKRSVITKVLKQI